MIRTPADAYVSLMATFCPKEEPSKKTIDVWEYVCKGIKHNVLSEATGYFIKNWTTEPYKPRVPTQADFLKVCRRIEKRIAAESKPPVYEDSRPLSVDQAEKLYREIKKKVAGMEVPADEPVENWIDIYEYFTPTAYKPYYVSHGHHGKEDFEKCCQSQFNITIKRIAHHYLVWSNIKSGDHRVNCWLPCGRDQKGAVPVTVGNI